MQERIRPSPPQSIPPHTTMPHADWIESQRKRVRLEHGLMIMIHVYTSRWDLVWFGDQPQPTPAKITLFIYYDGVTVQCLTLSKLYVDSQLSNCSGDPLVILDSEWMFRNDVRICSQRIYKDVVKAYNHPKAMRNLVDWYEAQRNGSVEPRVFIS